MIKKVLGIAALALDTYLLGRIVYEVVKDDLKRKKEAKKKVKIIECECYTYYENGVEYIVPIV